MKLTNIQIKDLIKVLGFLPQEGEEDLFYKKYSRHNNYVLKVNFETEKIEYGKDINLGDHTTSNFENLENFVVLECVDRILSKGYEPECLSLEHKWPMGRKEKGKLDILVLDNEGKAYLMIECKTWGEEYEKEKKKMQRDGGQLFSYYIQNKAAQYLCLYTSRLINSGIEFANDIVKVNDLWHELNDQKEIFEHWNKNFKDNGIFEEWASAYDVEIKALIKGRLKELNSEDSGLIFNQFAEILRHNVVSDKPNAFNKILNLFICKIIDEDKNENEEVDFQWLENDTNKSLQTRLNDLYREGMKCFLNIEVTDYSDKELEDKLYNINEPEIKKQIQDMFLQIRLQKNPEFAFKEVYNNQSFTDNGTVVKEIVELLQPFQFRYGHKQQFLGDFFELLLNTSIKQETGQYFTPVPITKFIISSLPIKEFIANKIQKNATDILPIAIDYATGSGHFLTEWMDEVQTIIDNLDISGLRPTATKKIKGWKQDQFEWTKEYVYGIEADYRLVKTTKVSSFLNGDGEAIIIRADGLDNFKKSKDYKGKLKKITKDDPKDNAQFDVLVANPPYSVSAFKNTVKHGAESFELFNRLTDSSSEIECLFVERTKQLLKVGGWAGIILPSSILSNSGIYTSAREIILKYFNIKAITEFGSNTFMATGTNTVTLFLERRENDDWKKVYSAIKLFFDRPKDVTVLGIEKVFSKYINKVFEDISFDDYVSFAMKNPNDKIKVLELYNDYIVWFNNLTEIRSLKDKKTFKELSKVEQKTRIEKIFFEKVFAIEQDKMLYFLLTYPQKTVIIKVGEKQAEKNFIGYEFSNRRGHEGIKMLPTGTKLYDEDGTINPAKANSYVYKAFLNEDLEIDESMRENISVVDTVGLLDFNKKGFEKSISLNPKKKVSYEHIWRTKQLAILSSIANIEKGTSITKAETVEGNIPVVAGGKEYSCLHNYSNRAGNVITVSASGANAGYLNYWNYPIFASDCNTIKSKDENNISTKLLYEFLKVIQDTIFLLQRGQAQPHVYGGDLEQIKIPVPSIDIQNKIVSEIEALEKLEQKNNNAIDKLKLNVLKLVYFNYSEERMDKISIMVQRGKSAKYGKSKTQIIKSGQARGYEEFNFSQKHYVSESFISDERNLIKGDILINSTGVGTAGRVTLFDLDGNFVADSHITIVRLDKSKALPKYVLYSLANIGFKNIEKMATGQSGQIELSLSIINNIKIPLPPLKYQQKIVSEIEADETKIYELEIKINEINVKKEKILKKYLY